jgi:hypothetical protein
MTMTRPVVLFPGAPAPAPAGLGLVTAEVTSATLDCTSGTPGSVTATYTVVLKWWGSIGGAAPAQHTATWTYNSASNGPPVVSGSATWNPAMTSLGGGLMLSDLVTAEAPRVVSAGGPTGQRGFPSGILTLNTASTLSNESGTGFSSIKVQLGQLTCVADDDR